MDLNKTFLSQIFIFRIKLKYFVDFVNNLTFYIQFLFVLYTKNMTKYKISGKQAIKQIQVEFYYNFKFNYKKSNLLSFYQKHYFFREIILFIFSKKMTKRKKYKLNKTKIK